MAEINPTHPATQGMHDLWHKMVAVLMMKYNVTHVLITGEDVKRLASNGMAAVVFQERSDGIHLNLVNGDGAKNLIANAKAVEMDKALEEHLQQMNNTEKETQGRIE